MPPPISAKAQIERLIREDWGRVLSVLIRTTGDFGLAEDALQDAVVAAMSDWPSNGVPKSPSAWLITAARRKAIDRFRKDGTSAKLAQDLALLDDGVAQDNPEETPFPDERLRLIFTCCHPALEEKSRIALTLRALGGLSTPEIAAAFLDKPATMAARLTRAKAKIASAGIPFRVPEPEDMAGRLAGVLRVIYLIFNEGYRASSGGELTRGDLIDEAIRLARIMRCLMPNSTEVTGLLALMLLHDSRRAARVDAQGKLVRLEDQNRARWSRAMIREGTELVEAALASGPPNPYAIQAAIAALHAESPSWEGTDWPQIAALYEVLWRLQPTAVVRVNRAVAVSFASGPAAGLAMLDSGAAEETLTRYQPYHVARADLLARLDRQDQAAEALLSALELTAIPQERAFLTGRLAELRKAH